MDAKKDRFYECILVFTSEHLFFQGFTKDVTFPAEFLHYGYFSFMPMDATEEQFRTAVTPFPTSVLPKVQTRPYLTVLFPLELHSKIDLGAKPSFIIGRGQEADLQIPDEMVSRRHCEIRAEGGHILVCDLDSTNGTFVDGSPIGRMELTPGHRLQIGKAILKVSYLAQEELDQENALFEAATTDALTRIPNRRFLMERARSEWSAAKRTHRPMHAILLDVDHFKKVNDTFGHPAGDLVLKEVASLLDKVRRNEDLLARWGGEEFIYLLSGIEPNQALAFAERVRKTIESHRISWLDQRIPVTISLGLASVVPQEQDILDEVIAAADAKLYEAKRSGRNLVCS